MVPNSHRPDAKDGIPDLKGPREFVDSESKRDWKEGSGLDYFRDPHYPYSDTISIQDFFRAKYTLQVELVKLQNWIVERGLKVLCIFEGRDTAGKGSTIQCFTEHLNPRGARVVALDKPSTRERGQWYFQRYVKHLPAAGEIVFFDRSWYNRAGVEKVMGFCSQEEYWQFVKHVPLFENMLAETGTQIFKFYLSISKEEQALRLHERVVNPLKSWKFSLVDQEAQGRWDAYTDAKEETFRRTDTANAPWTIIKADDRLRARLEAIRSVLTRIDYPDKCVDEIGEVDSDLVAVANHIYRPLP